MSGRREESCFPVAAYANAHRGKVRKATRAPVALSPKRRIGLRSAEMIRKVYEVDPMICARCGGRMKVVAFLAEYAVVDLSRVI